MKNQIQDMSHDEILALTPEELDFLVKFRCAQQGVKIVVKPIAPEKYQIPNDQRVKAFKVGDFVFKTEQEAIRYAECMTSFPALYKEDYDWRNSHDCKYLKPIEGYEINKLAQIEVVYLFEKPTYDFHAGKLQQSNKEYGVYEKALELFNKEEKFMDYIKEEILTIYNNHRDEEFDYKDNLAKFGEYLQLANGDALMAKTFFLKAYNPRDKTLKRVLRTHGLEVAEPITGEVIERVDVVL